MNNFTYDASTPEATKRSDTILAALRLLASSLRTGEIRANDGNVGDILTNGGKHEGMSWWAVEALADEFAGV